MNKANPPKLDYAGSVDIKLIPERRWLVLAILLALIALAISTFLPIWPASNFRGSWRTTLWRSNYFVIYD